MAHYGILDADAGLVAEFAGAWGSGLGGDFVERRARQVEHQAVIRVPDVGLRAAPQVVDRRNKPSA